MKTTIPCYVAADSVHSQIKPLNEAGFLLLRHVFEQDFFERLRQQLVEPYERFFVKVQPSIYTDRQFRDFVSGLVGCEVTTCSRIDRQTSWMRLYTTKIRYNPFSHFHIDLNRYHGRQFRVVINLVDDSDCDFEYKMPDGSIVSHPTEANSLCIIEAGRLSHRVDMKSGTRLLLMMDFTTTRTRGFMGWLAFGWDYCWMKLVAGRIRTGIRPEMTAGDLGRSLEIQAITKSRIV